MLISVIIPSYNSIKYIERCLSSVLSQAVQGVEIIVVDNGSTDGSVDLLKQKFPQVKLIYNLANLGSSYARNQGIELSSGEYIVFLDSDAYLAEDFLKVAADTLANSSYTIAGFTPKIINKCSGGVFSLGLKITPIFRVLDIKNKKNLKSGKNVDGFNSCCAVIRRSSLDLAKEGGEYFDNAFFFLFEDVDLSLRISRKGLTFIHLDKLLAYHYGSGSGYTSDFRRYLCFRNRMYMIFKNRSFLGVVGFFLRSFFYDSSRTLHFALTNKYAFLALNDIIKKVRKDNKRLTRDK